MLGTPVSDVAELFVEGPAAFDGSGLSFFMFNETPTEIQIETDQQKVKIKTIQLLQILETFFFDKYSMSKIETIVFNFERGFFDLTFDWVWRSISRLSYYTK